MSGVDFLQFGDVGFGSWVRQASLGFRAEGLGSRVLRIKKRRSQGQGLGLGMNKNDCQAFGGGFRVYKGLGFRV